MVRMGHDLVLVRPTPSLRQHEAAGYLTTKGPEGQRLRWPSIEVESVHLILEAAEGATAVWVDEPNLWKDEVDLFHVLQEVRGFAEILVSGCPATSELEPFGESFPKLIAVADEVVWCKADCDYTRRGNSASRSICLKEKDGQVLVGGEETYRPASPEAWAKWRHGELLSSPGAGASSG